MSDVKITRNGVEAEVVARYLPDFIADGWEVKKADAEIEALNAAEDARIKLEESQAALTEEKAKQNKNK
jgi:hypothetical protein